MGALRWLHSGESAVLSGPVGAGRAHIAQALGHPAVRQGANVRFAKTGRILADPAGGHADRTWDKRTREPVQPDVPILDGFAMRQPGASQADGLCELASERQGRSLATTGNRAPGDWYPLFPNRPDKRPENPAGRPGKPPFKGHRSSEGRGSCAESRRGSNATAHTTVLAKQRVRELGQGATRAGLGTRTGPRGSAA
ncbi:ATP-binding protein [Streptomyces virginiae]